MVKGSSNAKSNEKIVKSVESSHPGIIPPVKSFVLPCEDVTFAGRASNVFNRLSSLENQHSIWMSNNETHESFETDEASGVDPPSTSKTEEATTFKKPYIPLLSNKRRGNIIRKKKNARIWRKYSLKDTPLTSDAKNSAVAFQFLNELRKKREESISDGKVPDDGKVMFRKPKKRNLASSTVTSCTEVSSSSETAKESLPKDTDSAIKLDHLKDEYEFVDE